MPKMVNLYATRAFGYGVSPRLRLKPGDSFSAPSKHARVLVALKKAEIRREPVALPPPPPDVARTIAAHVAPHVEPAPTPSELAALRIEYEAAVGRKPFPGWGVDMLKAKIETAKASA